MGPTHRPDGRIRPTAALAVVLVAVPIAAAWLCAPARAEGVRDAVRDRLTRAAGKLTIDGAALNAPLLESLYRARNFEPIWRATARGADRASAIAHRLARAGEEGLDPENYGVAAIRRRLSAVDSAAAAELDLLLTDGLVRFVRDLRHGRLVLGDRERPAPPNAKTPSAKTLIAGALSAPDFPRFLAELSPSDPRYARLKAALKRYRAIAAHGEWPIVDPGRALRHGDDDRRVPALRRRLLLVGDLPRPAEDAAPGSESTLYDAPLAAAVRRFQRRHGLAADGVLGRRTRTALNVPATDRVRRIAINLERRRHLAGALGRRYVFVNIADATVKYVEDLYGVERTRLAMRAVVGLPYRETPVFTTVITQVQLNPSWYVPATIAEEDLLPRIRRNPRYLAEAGFDILTGAGPTDRVVDPKSLPSDAFFAKPFPYLLRQRPGPDNALGRIKFVMPNRHNVYLHDTPARALMVRPVRTFSSGCIRLEKPLELAALLLGMPRTAVEAAIDPGKMTFVPLTEPMPVLVAYLTAWANKDGSVHFRDDVYGRDSRLAKLLARR